MSEQEKANAIPTEGTITETKADERSWLKKFVDNHPKAWKWAKRIGVGLGATAGLVGAFELGRATGPKCEPMKLVEDTEKEETDETDDVFEE